MVDSQGLRLLDPRRMAVRKRLGLRLQHVVLVGDEVHAAAQNVEQLRVALLGPGHDLVAHVGAEPVRVGVRGILAPEAPLRIHGHRLFRPLPFDQVSSQIVPARIQQRAHDRPVAVPHGAEAARPRAHDGAHVEALHPVIGRMGRDDAAVDQRRGRMAAQALQRLVRRQVALAACHGLHVLARELGLARDVDLAREQRDVQQLGQLRHEARVGIGGFAAQPVVHVQHGQRSQLPGLVQLGGQVRERRGVRPARHHEQRRRVRTGEDALGKGGPHAVDGGWRGHGGSLREQRGGQVALARIHRERDHGRAARLRRSAASPQHGGGVRARRDAHEQ